MTFCEATFYTTPIGRGIQYILSPPISLSTRIVIPSTKLQVSIIPCIKFSKTASRWEYGILNLKILMREARDKKDDRRCNCIHLTHMPPLGEAGIFTTWLPQSPQVLETKLSHWYFQRQLLWYRPRGMGSAPLVAKMKGSKCIDLSWFSQAWELQEKESFRTIHGTTNIFP